MLQTYFALYLRSIEVRYPALLTLLLTLPHPDPVILVSLLTMSACFPIPPSPFTSSFLFPNQLYPVTSSTYLFYGSPQVSIFKPFSFTPVPKTPLLNLPSVLSFKINPTVIPLSPILSLPFASFVQFLSPLLLLLQL